MEPYLHNILAQAGWSGFPQVVEVTDPPGSGKSFTLAQACREIYSESLAMGKGYVCSILREYQEEHRSAMEITRHGADTIETILNHTRIPLVRRTVCGGDPVSRSEILATAGDYNDLPTVYLLEGLFDIGDLTILINQLRPKDHVIFSWYDGRFTGLYPSLHCLSPGVVRMIRPQYGDGFDEQRPYPSIPSNHYQPINGPIATLPMNAYNALMVGLETGMFDGDHHKMWAIDQMVRAISPLEYASIIAEYEERDENGDPQYDWSVGIAP